MNKNHIPNISGHSVEVKNSGGFSDKTRETEINENMELVNKEINKNNMKIYELEQNLPARSHSQINKLLMQNLGVNIDKVNYNENLKFEVVINGELINENLKFEVVINSELINENLKFEVVIDGELNNNNLQIQNDLLDNNFLGEELGKASSEEVNFFLLSKANLNKININEKNKNATNVASMIMQIRPDSNIYNNNKYVNVSTNNSKKIEPAKVKALLDMGVKPVFNLTTEDGRSIRTTAEHPYLVRGKKEFQNENVSDYSLFKTSLMNLSVVNILTNDCCLRCGSLDQTSQFNFNASATKSTSFLCGIDSTLGRNFLYSSIGMNSTNIANSLNKSLNSFLEIPVFLDISSEFLLSSSNANSGAKKSKSWSTNIPLVNESFQKKVNKTFESTTNFIYINPFDFNSSYLPCLDALCNLTDQSIMSLSSCKCFSNLCINKDNFIPEISTCFSNSAGISSLIVTFSMIEDTDNKYLNVSNGIACLQKLPARSRSQIYEVNYNENLKCGDGLINENIYVNNVLGEKLGKVGFENVNSEPSRSEGQSEENLNKIDNNEKNKKGSNGVEPNKLSSDYDNYKEQKYLNISVDVVNSRAEMAEWLTQSVVIRCPSGCVGSIPTLGADDNSKYKIKKVQIKDIKSSDYVLSLNESSGKIEPSKVKALLNIGIKPTFNLTTEDGRSIRTTAEHPYLTEKGWLKVSELKGGESITVPRLAHNSSFSSSSDVGNILILNCSLNAGSFDQIGQSNFNASANIGMSLSCISCLDSCSNDLENSSGIILMNSFNSSKIESICSDCNLQYFEIDNLIFNNSCQQCSGEYNSKFNNCAFKIVNLTGFSLKNEINMLVSTTNCIYHPSFFNFSQAFCFTSLPNLKQSSSVSSEFSNILSNFLSNKALLTFSDKNLRIDSERFSSGNELICSFNSLGIDNVKFGIFEFPSLVYSVEAVQVYKSFDFSEKGANIARSRSQIDKLLMQNLKCDMVIDDELINENNKEINKTSKIHKINKTNKKGGINHGI